MIDFAIYLNHFVGLLLFISYLIFVKWFLMTFILVTKMTFFFTPYLFFRLRNLALSIEYMDSVAREKTGQLFSFVSTKLNLLEDYVESEDVFRKPIFSPTSTDLMLFKTIRIRLKKVKPTHYNHDFLDN